MPRGCSPFKGHNWVVPGAETPAESDPEILRGMPSLHLAGVPPHEGGGVPDHPEPDHLRELYPHPSEVSDESTEEPELGVLIDGEW